MWGGIGVVAAFEFRGAAAVQGGVDAVAIVEGLDVVEDGQAGAVGVGEHFALLGLEGAEEALHGGVVMAVAPGAHALAQAMAGEQLPERPTGILDAAIGMHDEPGLPVAGGQGLLEGGGHQRGLQGAAQAPADDLAAGAVA